MRAVGSAECSSTADAASTRRRTPSFSRPATRWGRRCGTRRCSWPWTTWRPGWRQVRGRVGGVYGWVGGWGRAVHSGAWGMLAACGTLGADAHTAHCCSSCRRRRRRRRRCRRRRGAGGRAGRDQFDARPPRLPAHPLPRQVAVRVHRVHLQRHAGKELSRCLPGDSGCLRQGVVAAAGGRGVGGGRGRACDGWSGLLAGPGDRLRDVNCARTSAPMPAGAGEQLPPEDDVQPRLQGRGYRKGAGGEQARGRGVG